MATINNQATLRTAVAEWLNRTDLTTNQIDTFIEIGEAKAYELLRIPTMEALEGFSVTESNSSISIPAGFLELIELRMVKAGTCSVAPSTNTTRALCSLASGTWTDADKNDDVSYRRVDGKTFHNNRINYAFTRELTSFLLTDKEGKQEASGEFVLKYYKAGVAIGTTTGSPAVEVVPWILSDAYEVILYSSLASGSSFLGDVEGETRYVQMFIDKISSLNEEAKRAELKGGIFTQVFSASLI